MTMHFRILFNKYNVKLSDNDLKELRKDIHNNRLNLKDAIDDFTSPIGTANGGADIDNANKSGLKIIEDWGVIYNFNSNNFINHMFCSYETGGSVLSYKDVNFKDPDFGPIPCDPNNWSRVLNELKNRLNKRLSTRNNLYDYQKTVA